MPKVNVATHVPSFADTNIIMSELFGTKMSGDYRGEKILSIQKGENEPGIIKDHLITTGIQNFYEGITISNVKIAGGLKPLVYSSDGKVVTAYYDMEGKRCLVDGGFTRLESNKWLLAGTDRFVINCAAWLTNVERFGYYPDINVNTEHHSKGDMNLSNDRHEIFSLKNIFKKNGK